MKGFSGLASILDRISNECMRRIDALNLAGVIALVVASLSVIAFMLYELSSQF